MESIEDTLAVGPSETSTATFGASSGSEEGAGNGVNAMAVPAIADHPMPAIEDDHPTAITDYDQSMVVVPTKGRSSSSKRSSVFYIEDVPKKTIRSGRSTSPRNPVGGGNSSRSTSRKPPAINDREVSEKIAKPLRDSSVRSKSAAGSRAVSEQSEILEALLNPASIPVPTSTIHFHGPNGVTPDDHMCHERVPAAVNEVTGEAGGESACVSCAVLKTQLERSEYLWMEERKGFQSQLNVSKEQVTHLAGQIQLLERHVDESRRHEQPCAQCEDNKKELGRQEYLWMEERKGFQTQLQLSTDQCIHLVEKVKLLERHADEAKKEKGESDERMRREAEHFKTQVENEAVFSQTKFSNIEHENKAIKADLNRAITEGEALAGVVNGLRAEIARGNESRVAKDETIARLERLIRTSSEGDSTGAAELNFKLAKTECSLVEVNQELVASRGEIDKLKDQNEQGQKALEERSNEINGLRSMTVENDRQYRLLEGRLRDTEALLDDSRAEMLSTRNQNEEGSVVLSKEAAEKIRRMQEENVERILHLEKRLETCVLDNPIWKKKTRT